MKAKVYEVTIAIPEDDVVSLFISACEGGSNYWCHSVVPKNAPKPVGAYEALLEGFTVVDGEAQKTVKVTPKMIEKGLELWPKLEPVSFADFLTGDWDAATADTFLQLCTFGEVVYG